MDHYLEARRLLEAGDMPSGELTNALLTHDRVISWLYYRLRDLVLYEQTVLGLRQQDYYAHDGAAGPAALYAAQYQGLLDLQQRYPGVFSDVGPAPIFPGPDGEITFTQVMCAALDALLPPQPSSEVPIEVVIDYLIDTRASSAPTAAQQVAGEWGERWPSLED
jgi:hypothetical protein